MKSYTIDLCHIFQPESCDDLKPAIFIIGGSSGGLRSKFQAEYFAAQGYPSAVIPYFALEGLPSELKLISLNYFQNAVSSLQRDPLFKDRRVFIQGTSKGAEATLLLAAKNLVCVTGIILISPSAYCWAAPADFEKLKSGEETEHSSWSYNGEEVPFVRTDLSKRLSPEVVKRKGEDYYSYRKTWHPRVQGDVGKIDLAALSTKLLIFSGDDDHLWPSYEAATIIENDLDSSGKADLVKHISFKQVGHLIPLPGNPPKIFSFHPELKINILYGGEKESVEAASKIYWDEIQKFINL